MLQNPFDSTKYKYDNKMSDYILYFGRIIEEKGVDVLIRSMQ